MKEKEEIRFYPLPLHVKFKPHPLTIKGGKGGKSKNKTSIQWTPGSQIYRSNQTIIFSKK